LPVVKGRRAAAESNGLLVRLSERVVGQPNAMTQIVPYVEMYQAGLAPEGRPAGVFLLLGPTGTGKTRTVEALADVLHGNQKNVLRVDCGEFQMEHEVAKLIGAPPGYLGHRETQPMLTQNKLGAITSEGCGLSLVLFDEIEKAAASMTRLLLGVLDKAVEAGGQHAGQFRTDADFYDQQPGRERDAAGDESGFRIRDTGSGGEAGFGEKAGRDRGGRGAAKIFAGVHEPDRRDDYLSAAEAGGAQEDSGPAD